MSAKVGRAVTLASRACRLPTSSVLANASLPFFELDQYVFNTAADIYVPCSESTSIPKNPRTDRPVGYAFVDLSTPSEAERAITELSGKEILERKVSVQLARKPEPNAEKGEGATSGGEGASGGEGRRRQSGRGRGRGRGRGGRGGRSHGAVSLQNPARNSPTDKSIVPR